jgi:hypothetical protein
MALKKRAKSLSVSTGGTSGRPLDDRQDLLESWKEIGAFVGRDERTAMRWAKDHGMPVHRTPGKRGRVSGSRSEISAWLAGSGDHTDTALPPALPRPTEFSKPNLWVAVVLFAVVGIGGIWIRSSMNGSQSVRVTFSADSMRALGGDGRILWTHSFSAPLDPGPVDGSDLSRIEELTRIADLLGDGGREVVVVAPLRLGPNTQSSFRMEIDCFSSKGKLLWSYSPGDAFKFGEYELGGPWNLFDIMVSRRRGTASIYAAFNHREWGNSFVVEIDPATGRGIVRFVNTGTTRTLDELRTPDATYLLAGGFNNEYDGGSLAVIEEGKPFGASPQTPGSRHECVSCPRGVPDWYFVFPRSELDGLRKVYENPIIKQDVKGTRFELWKSELVTDRGSRGAQTFYTFEAEPSIHPISLRYSSTYETLHREAEKNGELDHSLAACPERLRPAPIRVWTPSGGWSELKVRPVQ